MGSIRLLASSGFGNQLFQYAAVRAQAKRIGANLEIDTQFFQQGSPHDSKSFWLETLPIKARIIRYPTTGFGSAESVFRKGYRNAIRPFFWKEYKESLWGNNTNFFKIKSKTIIYGYFQSLCYLMPRDDEILSELNLWKVVPPQAAELAHSIRRGNYVSLHVRRGDYLDHPDFGHIDYLSYATAAMDWIRRKVGSTTFLIFSDDINWCKQSQIFANDAEFVDTNRYGLNPGIDLLLMSSCRHHIIANSSYSWWAAWSNLHAEQICIAPKYWVRNRETRCLGLAYPTWVIL